MLSMISHCTWPAAFWASIFAAQPPPTSAIDTGIPVALVKGSAMFFLGRLFENTAPGGHIELLVGGLGSKARCDDQRRADNDDLGAFSDHCSPRN